MPSETAVSLPVAALRPFIAQYAGFRASGFPPAEHHGLPSSKVDLIISLGQPIEIVRMPNATQPPAALQAFVAGLQDVPAVIRQEREAFGLHVFIKPFGVRAILGIANTELSSLVVNLSDILGRHASDLLDRLIEAETWPRRFAILDRAFLAKLYPSEPRPEIVWAWSRLKSAHGAIAVEQLAREIGWSRRHFGDQFRDAVGIAPKTAARVLRFERACRVIADQRPSLAHVALACGYYDQAHLTREWNALAGCSPKEWIACELPFLQDYELRRGDTEADDTQTVY